MKGTDAVVEYQALAVVKDSAFFVVMAICFRKLLNRLLSFQVFHEF